MSSRNEVYQAVGRALELSQLFETELGTALLALDALESNSFLQPDADAYLRLREEVDRLTLGKSLKRIKKRLSLSEDLELLFQEALDARNFLAHHLFKRDATAVLTSDGCAKLLLEIEGVSTKVTPAYSVAQNIAGTLVSQVVLANGARA